MKYYFDFDRTVFDTESFKKDFAHRATLRELGTQAKELVRETFSDSRTLSFRKIVMRTLGTYASHRRLGFEQHELKEYLYPDAVEFFTRYGKDCTIVTYGVQAFITAKVTNALTEFPLGDIVYTSRKKGRTLKRLTKGQKGPFTFVDDAHFQLESVGKVCPEIELYEIRRDGHEGDGRWPVIHSLLELPGTSSEAAARPARELDFSTQKVAVILNKASGSYSASAEGKVRDLLKEAAIANPKVWCVMPEEIPRAFEEVSAYKPDILIVLAGDGTIRTAAESCTSEGPLLIPLPGGTMNMLPKALYGNRPWPVVLRDTLSDPYIRSVSGGRVGEREFFIAAVIGAPTLWAEVREALRRGLFRKVVRKGMHALKNMLASKVHYSFSEQQEGEADALMIICPLISDSMSDAEQSLEAAVIDVRNARGVLNLASAAAFGKWRESAHVSTVKTKSVTISANRDVPLILDGETIDLGKSVEVCFMPQAFKALVPAKG